jgi:uncharacterized protein (TIGR02058 family)
VPIVISSVSIRFVQGFPYGTLRIQLSKDGGMIASNGKMTTEMGDTNDDMIIVCVAVTVEY